MSKLLTEYSSMRMIDNKKHMLNFATNKDLAIQPIVPVLPIMKEYQYSMIAVSSASSASTPSWELDSAEKNQFSSKIYFELLEYVNLINEERIKNNTELIEIKFSVIEETEEGEISNRFEFQKSDKLLEVMNQNKALLVYLIKVSNNENGLKDLEGLIFYYENEDKEEIAELSLGVIKDIEISEKIKMGCELIVNHEIAMLEPYQYELHE